MFYLKGSLNVSNSVVEFTDGIFPFIVKKKCLFVRTASFWMNTIVAVWYFMWRFSFLVKLWLHDSHYLVLLWVGVMISCQDKLLDITDTWIANCIFLTSFRYTFYFVYLDILFIFHILNCFLMVFRILQSIPQPGERLSFSFSRFFLVKIYLHG